MTCYYTAMTMREWNRFADGIEASLYGRVPPKRGAYPEGGRRTGTTTLAAQRRRPCETVFSGPAASTMGKWP